MLTPFFSLQAKGREIRLVYSRVNSGVSKLTKLATLPIDCCYATDVLHLSAYFSAVKWLGCMKVCTTVIKYAPQVHLNWQGWSGSNAFFDFLGGLLSVVQA